MIYKIIQITSVGLFANGIPSAPLELKPSTLFYAENGRGKSTLSSIFRAYALQDASRINARKTIDSPNDPEISLLFQTGTNRTKVTFKRGSWSSSYPNIAIFDSEFVDQNVYSGFEVRTDQRQSLLDFALGDDAVALKNQIYELTRAIEIAGKRRTDAEKQLSGYLGTNSLANFISLQPKPEIETEISLYSGRIDAAKRARPLLQRPVPVPLSPISFDLEMLFEVLGRDLADLEQSSESIIRDHLEKHGQPDMEDWISHGQSFLSDGFCPFCGQPLSDLGLIRAYQAYFNQEYQELKTQVADIAEKIRTELGSERINSLRSAVNTNDVTVNAWNDQLALSAPELPISEIEQNLGQLARRLQALIEIKRAQPLEKIGATADRQLADAELAVLNFQIEQYNKAVAQATDTIQEYKHQLSSENPTQLQEALKHLEAVQKRYLPKVVDLIAEYQTSEAERKLRDEEKTRVRNTLDGLMTKTLEQYQTRVNELLGSFGTAFRIEQLKHNYRGSGDPRSDYGLSVRNKPVKLGSRDDMANTPSFGSSLSEADKRTLAFAFFIARLERNEKLNECIVIFDDPVSSLDLNRRRESIRLIANLSNQCEQLITLSHDAYFAKDLRDKILAVNPHPERLVLYGIHRAGNDYSALGECNVDEICASDYYRHYKLVTDYIDGNSTCDPRDVAKAIRPMLEGYYHRRFPGLLPKRTMFGNVLKKIEEAVSPDPLINLQPQLTEMSEVNEYASGFHHDTNAEADHVTINESELLRWARRSLELIYK